jgi:hypothetical protein
MKKEHIPEIRGVRDFRACSESFDSTKGLGRILRDLEHRQCWKYGLFPPVQLLEKLTLGGRPLDKDELARADFFWKRRPRLLPIVSYIAWLVVALGLPFWLFSVPALGYPLLIISAVVVNIEIVRSVRWRRQYELGIDRLILTPALTEMPAPGDPS